MGLYKSHHPPFLYHHRSRITDTMSTANSPHVVRWGILSTGGIATTFAKVSLVCDSSD